MDHLGTFLMMKTIDDGRHFLLTLTLAGCCVAAAAGPAAAQVLPPANRFQMSLDWSRFRGEDDQHEQVEVYYSFPQRSLTFLKDSSSYSGGIRMSYSLRTSATDSVIGGDKWIVPVVITDTTAAGVSLDLVGKYDLSLTAGDYILRLSARDMHDTTRADSLATLIPVRPLATDKLRISDIELASMVRQDTTSPGVNRAGVASGPGPTSWSRAAQKRWCWRISAATAAPTSRPRTRSTTARRSCSATAWADSRRKPTTPP